MTSREIGYEPIDQLIQLTSISRRTATNLIKSGEIPGKKIGGQYFVTRSYLRKLEQESV